MNAPEFKTLADPIFQSIFNKGEPTMNDIICETTEEHSHPSTTLITSTPQTGQAVPNQPVQGVSGASYAPMDTTPQTPEQQANARVKMFMEMITTALNGLVKELQTPTQPQTDLIEAVDVALGNAEWFKDRVEENCAEAITDHDFDYEIGQNIERYMRNSFDANDHYDFDAEVRSRVEDELESIIDGLVEEAVEARLAELLEEKLANANITINF